MKYWSAVFAKPRQEALAKDHLGRQGFRTYLPMLKQPKRRRGRWVEIVEPLFPRYLFVELELGAQDISPIRSTLGVVSLVSFGQRPAAAPKGFVESLMAAEVPDCGYCFARAQPFQKGEQVRVAAGPLAGVEAIFLEPAGEGRVALMLTLLGRANRIEIDADRLVAAS